MKKVAVVSFVLGALCLTLIGAKYTVPSGHTVLIVDSPYQDPFDPCDPVYDNLYDPPADWLLKHGNSERSLLLFNLSYVRRRADINLQLINKLQEPDPNEPGD